MARRSTPLLIAALLAVATACGGGTDQVGEAPAAAAAQGAPVAVPEVLQFTTVDLSGAPVDGASFADRPVAFWFWAPG
jgi:cytochrome oxidase Cu insertion factor (SCO1/SenC/PrrC family)